MIKVTALTAGKYDPSGRFRVRQFIQPLKSFGIELCEYYPRVNKYTLKRFPPLGALSRFPGLLDSRGCAVTLLGRELLAGRFGLERYAGGKCLVDIDDAIWLNGANFSEKLAHFCNGVIAGNAFIGDHYRQLGARVWEIPTSLDTDSWRPRTAASEQPWTIGWTGSSSNLRFLAAIEEPLGDFLRDHPDCRFLLVCNKKPVFKKLPAASWESARWSPETEVSLVQSMDVGLMPLPETEWSLGKCALKMIMYMAVGIPSVVSPVGVGGELLKRNQVGLPARTTHDWYAMLRTLFADKALAARMGLAGRLLAEEEFSVTRNAPKLAAVIREVAGRQTTRAASL